MKKILFACCILFASTSYGQKATLADTLNQLEIQATAYRKGVDSCTAVLEVWETILIALNKESMEADKEPDIEKRQLRKYAVDAVAETFIPAVLYITKRQEKLEEEMLEMMKTLAALRKAYVK